MPCVGGILDARKVFLASDLGYRGQHLSQVAFARAVQHTRKNFPVLGLGAAAVSCPAA